MQRALPLLLAFAIAGTSSAAAHQQDDETISKRLLLLLFPGMIESIVEGLPGDFPDDLLPEGATPLASATSIRSVSVVAELPTPFASADRPRYERKLAAAGWKAGDGPHGGVGLMDSPMPVPSMFCKGDEVLTYSSQPQRGGRALFRLSLMETGGYGPCGGEGSRGPGDAFAEVDVPALPPPPGSTGNGTSSSSGGDFTSQSVRLQTALGASEVEAHYTALLTDYGWKMSTRAAGEGLSLTRFTVAAAENVVDKSPRAATVEALALPGGDVLVTLRVIGAGGRRWQP